MFGKFLGVGTPAFTTPLPILRSAGNDVTGAVFCFQIDLAHVGANDADGKEVYRHAVRSKNGNTKELALVRNSDNVDKWGKLDVATGEFTVEVIAQLSTGERPTAYTGKLVP